eukprot:13995241-Heterocapsa_arctica.AAC.1
MPLCAGWKAGGAPSAGRASACPRAGASRAARRSRHFIGRNLNGGKESVPNNRLHLLTQPSCGSRRPLRASYNHFLVRILTPPRRPLPPSGLVGSPLG